MGLFDFFKNCIKRKPVADTPQQSTPTKLTSSATLSYSDKERIMVQRVTIEDMRCFPGLPYQLNTKIEKFILPQGHPFAYMNLTGENIDIAKAELSKINTIFTNLHKKNRSVPSLNIPVAEIRFKPSEHYGYTRLMCTPKTFTGELSEYPLSLCFMTDLEADNNTASGNIFYLQNGKIGKADIHLWKKHKGYSVYLEAVDGDLVVCKIELSDITDRKLGKDVIYKADHVLAAEAAYKQTEYDYIWLQANFPDNCPKTLTGYRRMKTQNTKNYQVLKQLADEHGRII